MKLVRRTANTLTMRYLPWGTWLMMGYLAAKFLLIVSFFFVSGSSQNDPLFLIPILVPLVFLGGLITYTTGVLGGIRTLRLNKLTGKLTLQQQTIWGTKLIEHPLKKVADVVVMNKVPFQPHRVLILLAREQPDLSGRSRLSQIILLQSSLLYLQPMYGLSLRWFECKRCAEQIRDFLNLPSKSGAAK